MIYSSARIKRTVIIHLDKGEDLLASICEVIKKEGIASGLILSGYGTLDRVRWHYITTTGLPVGDQMMKLDGVIAGGMPQVEVAEGAFELIGMDGVIAGGKPHIHFDASSPQCSIGGHLHAGTRVLYLADIVIAELEDVELTLKMDRETNLTCLDIKPGITEPGPAVEPNPQGEYKIVGRTTGWI